MDDKLIGDLAKAWDMLVPSYQKIVKMRPWDWQGIEDRYIYGT